MRQRNIISTVIGLLLLALAAFVWLGPAGSRQVPDITLTTIKGEKLDMQSLRGRPVLVTFWATSCSSCIQEIPDLLKLHASFADKGLEIIAIAMSYDPPNLVKTFTEQRKLPYVVALDLDGRAAEAFDQVRVTPTNFLIAPDGRILKKNIGPFKHKDMHAIIAAILNTAG